MKPLMSAKRTFNLPFRIADTLSELKAKRAERKKELKKLKEYLKESTRPS